jgi:Tfp pilus assembly protein PilF
MIKMRFAKYFVMIGLLGIVCGLTGCSSWKSWGLGTESRSKKLWEQKAPVALDTKPDTRQAQIDLALAAGRQLESRLDYPGAMKRYQEVLVLDKKHALAHHRMALLATRMSATQQAQEHFQTALSITPKDDALIADYAYWHYLHGNNEQSLELVKQGLARSAGYQRFHGIRGLVLARQRQYESAVASFLESGCNQQEAWANVGHVLLLDGDVESAQYWIGHAAQGERGSEVARNTQRVIQASYISTQP